MLGVLLIVRRPDDLVPRLLALGLLGTAATFNLPSHEAFHMLGSPWPIAMRALHLSHRVRAWRYLWAVVLFPDGRLPARIALSGRSLTFAAVGGHRGGGVDLLVERLPRAPAVLRDLLRYPHSRSPESGRKCCG